MKKIISLLLAITVIISGFALNFNSYAEVEEEINRRVLLIQDNLPWDSNANEIVLEQIGVDYTKISTSQFQNTDIWNYGMVIVANDQNFDTYNNFKDFKEQLDLFANLGGVIIYGACDEGWANGTIQTDLPGGVKKEHNLIDNNYIVDYNHPIVTGELSDNVALTDDMLFNNFCSHNDFIEESLPADVNVVLKSASGAPTLIEYSLGSGYIIASTLTWEHSYEQYIGGSYFGRRALDDLFLYGLSLCGDVENDTPKMAIKKDNNSFGHTASSFFYDYENKEYLMSDHYFNKLNSYYEESLWEWLPFTKNVLQKQRVSEWGGSCYGLSISMALAYLNEIDFEAFAGVEDYYMAPSPKNDIDFRDLINYYQLCQYLPVIDKKGVTAYADDTNAFKTELRTVVELAKQSEKSRIPFIFTMGYSYEKLEEGKYVGKSAGHAIVCVGIEEFSDYYRIQFIDPNKQDGYLYARIDKDYSSINFEQIYKDIAGNKRYFTIKRVGHDTISNFKEIDIDGDALKQRMMRFAAQIDDMDVFIFDSNSSFKLINENGEYLVFDGVELTGNIEIIDTQYYEKDESFDYQIAIPFSATYRILVYSEELDMSIYNNDKNYYAFSGSSAEEININMSNSIAVEGDQMDYKAFVGGVNGENTDMISFENSDADEITMIMTDEQVVLDGDNLSNGNVDGYCDANVYSIEPEQKNGKAYVDKDNELVAEVSIQAPSRNEIRNKDGIILHANVEGAPSGSYVKWASSNSNFDKDELDDGTKLEIIARNKGWTTFTATLYDIDGNILGTDTVEMYSKSGFFDKIGGFFRSLFGTTKIYDN